MTKLEAVNADAAFDAPTNDPTNDPTGATAAAVSLTATVTPETPEPTASSGEGIGYDEEATKALGGRGIVFKLPRPTFVPDRAALDRLIDRHDLNVREELALYYQLPPWDGVERAEPAKAPRVPRRPWEGR